MLFASIQKIMDYLDPRRAAPREQTFGQGLIESRWKFEQWQHG